MQGKKNLILGLAGILVLGLSISLKAEEVYEEWVARHDGWAYSYNDFGKEVNLDKDGFIFVTGDSGTIRYSPQGAKLWLVFHGGDAVSTAIDSDGFLYVSKMRYPRSTDILKISPHGQVLWKNTYNLFYGSYLAISGITADGIYSAATIIDSFNSADYFIRKHSLNGQLLWERSILAQTAAQTSLSR